MSDPEMTQLSAQLERLEERLGEQHERLGRQIEEVARKVERIDQQLRGAGESPRLASRLLLTEQRLQLVYWILGLVGTLAITALWQTVFRAPGQ